VRAVTMPAAMRTPTILRTAAAMGALLPLALAACGGGESGSALPANPDLTVQALDIKFDKPAYTAPAGDVEVAYVSKGQQVHSMVLLEANGDRIPDFRLQVSPGKSVGGSVELSAGTYTMICDIPGHEAAGMVAELVVS
jgi:plastocyanin